MLSSRKTMCMLLVCLCTYATSLAQVTTAAKPKVFDTLPSSISISESLLESFFNLDKNQETTLALGDKFSFPGKVLSNEVKYSNLQTIIVKSSAFNNAIFQVSRIINEDKSISYTGRILNIKAFDGFEIKKNAAGFYELLKFETDQVTNDCSL